MHPEISFEDPDWDAESRWEGMFPSAEDMAAYAKVSPDLPAKILRVAVEEYEFHRDRDLRRERAQHRHAITVVIAAVVFLAFSVAMASALARQGADFGALVIVAVPALSLLAYMILQPLGMKRAIIAAYRQVDSGVDEWPTGRPKE